MINTGHFRFVYILICLFFLFGFIFGILVVLPGGD